MTTVRSDAQDRLDAVSRAFCAVPAVAALFYPIALVAFYAGGRMVHAASTWEGLLSGWVVTVGAAILVYGVPVTSLWVIDVLGRLQAPSLAQLRARRFAHLAFASPPLFTATGVVLYLFHASSDYIVWPIIWIPIILVMLLASDDGPVAGTVGGKGSASSWLRVAHGLSAATILLIFLVPHIANHLTAVWNSQLHKVAMNMLRLIYRSGAMQPALVGLMLFQIASGGALLRKRIDIGNDLLGSLQTASGAYLAAFIVSHLTAVFVLGRWTMGVDTNWDFAIGAPAGMMGDAWNVRLVPHYSLAVFLLFTHLACGLRMVLMAHDVSPAAVRRAATSLIMLGGIIAATITSAMLGVHIAI